MCRRALQRLALAALAGLLGLAATPPDASTSLDVAVRQDPTRPPGFGGEKGETVPAIPGDPLSAPIAFQRLTATVVTPGESFAVIDGQKVEEGDELADGRVVRIGPAGVQVEGSSGTFELRFYALPVKAPTATQLALDPEEP